MLFNSIDFALFLPIFFIGYWFITNKNLRLQNLFVVIASYFFYGWWDWRFLSLLFISTLTDYIIGLLLVKQKTHIKRKILLITSIVVNLGILGFFKYYNFFIENFVTLFSFFGKNIQVQSLHIILPIGISFYTFQTLSYCIDIYRNKFEPTKDFIAFAAFVSFFPQLVAGPIERAKNLLPQFYKKRIFNPVKAVDGMRQILWGLFKKMVIADNCAEYVNLIFNNSADYGGSTLLIGAIFFAFQIYGDFSGYSDIAIGTARLFGIDLMRNFAFPYFSRDIAEFWRRWHISLTSWFRDYVYIPLGGSQQSLFITLRNIFIIFLLSGFWHGANWTFIAWGTLNALYFIPLLILKRNRKNIETVAHNRNLPSWKEFLGMVTTFGITLFAWIFFRAENITHAFDFIAGIFSKSLFTLPNFPGLFDAFVLMLLITIFIIVEWLGRNHSYAIAGVGYVQKKWVRWGIYYIITMAIFFFAGKEQQFIYFQF